jgi:hypothetical protein
MCVLIEMPPEKRRQGRTCRETGSVGLDRRHRAQTGLVLRLRIQVISANRSGGD